MPIVLTFVSHNGGVEKSALARSTAVALARAKINVLLADCDEQQSTVTQWSRVRSDQKRMPLISVLSARSASDALAGGQECDVPVLDMPGRVSRATLDAARQSHINVHPTGPTLDDLHPSVLLFHELVGAGIPKERLIFVLCRTLAKAEEDAARDYLQRAGYEVLPQALAEKIGYREALNHGGSAIETEDSALNKQASAVVDGILKRVNEIVDRLQREQSATPGKEGSKAR